MRSSARRRLAGIGSVRLLTSRAKGEKIVKTKARRESRPTAAPPRLISNLG